MLYICFFLHPDRLKLTGYEVFVLFDSVRGYIREWVLFISIVQASYVAY